MSEREALGLPFPRLTSSLSQETFRIAATPGGARVAEFGAVIEPHAPASRGEGYVPVGCIREPAANAAKALSLRLGPSDGGSSGPTTMPGNAASGALRDDPMSVRDGPGSPAAVMGVGADALFAAVAAEGI